VKRGGGGGREASEKSRGCEVVRRGDTEESSGENEIVDRSAKALSHGKAERKSGAKEVVQMRPVPL